MDRARMDLTAGQVWWAELSPTRGREQPCRRPVVVVSGDRYHALVETMTIVAPITSTDRSWPNHVPVTAGRITGFVMTEQLRTISRERLVAHEADASRDCLHEVRRWIGDYLADDIDGWTD